VDPGGDVVVYDGRQVEAVRPGLLGQQVHDLVHDDTRVEVDRIERHPAGLDLREVEQVVDERQQRLGAGLDRLGGVALVGGEVGVQQQAGHPDDAVHRGPDLVADVREQLGLEPAKLQRLLVQARVRGGGGGLLGVEAGVGQCDRGLGRQRPEDIGVVDVPGGRDAVQDEDTVDLAVSRKRDATDAA
jgi:hypothetical protein